MNLSTEEFEEQYERQASPPGRRTFLIILSLVLGAFCSAIVGLPIVGSLIGPRLLGAPKDVWRPVGKTGAFKVGETVEVVYINPDPLSWAGVTDKTGAWLRRDDASHFTAFSLNCQHLGCPVRWEAGAELFMCPCHGGIYYADGTVAAGPPPRALQRYPTRVRDGQVEIHTSPIPLPGFE